MSPFIIRKTKIRELPVNNDNFTGISSDWAYDHAALTTAHGISTFGATLVDDADAPTARTTLGAPGFTISASAPATPNARDIWWDSESGLIYVWYTDTNSSQWVSNGSAGKPFSYPIDDTPVNGELTHSISSNWAYDHTASATAHAAAASQGEMEVGSESAIRSLSPLNVSQAISALAPDSFTRHIVALNFGAYL